MKIRLDRVCLLAAALTGCASVPPAIPVYADADQVGVLVGDWAGSYAYEQGEWRSGSIAFVLGAAGDTARGDVLMMVPPDPTIPASDATSQWVQVQPANPVGQVLSISFIRAAGGAVMGELDPYVDPACRCVLITRFAGRVEGETVVGSFTSRRADTGEVRTGRWKVSRRHE